MERPEFQNISTDNYSVLCDLCSQYLDLVKTGSVDDSDLEHYIFEVALESVYGDDVWKYVNERIK